MSKKINLSNENLVKEKILNAAQKCAELAGMTLGPDGKSVIIEKGIGEPLIVDDGRRTLENIQLEDSVEQLVVRTLSEITKKTDEKVGDGTTTSIILAYAILKNVFHNRMKSGGILDSGASVSKIDKELKESLDLVLKKLEEKRKEVTTEQQLIDVAKVSVGDEKLGEIIGKMYWQLGKDGHITLEYDTNSEEVTTEIIPGFRFNAGLAKRWMMTNQLRQEAFLKESFVLISDQRDLNIEDLKIICSELQNSGRKCLTVIAPKFSEHFINSALKTLESAGFLILCVRAPSLHEEHFKDLAIWSGGKVFTDKDDVKSCSKKDLGFVESLTVSHEDGAHLVGGIGDKENIKKRVEEVKAEMNDQKVFALKQLRLERISALSGGAGVIKIGAPTIEEMGWLKHKIEDAKFATKYAYREGVVLGGGMTFKQISEELPENNILKESLLAPYNQLKKNSGGEFEVKDNVLDSFLVEKSALQIAISAVSKLIRVGGAIASKPKKDFEESLSELIKKVTPSQVEDDE